MPAPTPRIRSLPAFPSLRAFPLLLAVFGPMAAAVPSRAQSIAALLASYEAERRVAGVAGVTAVSFSGVAWNPPTRTLYAIDNDNAVVYELDTTGALKRSLSTTGFVDPEGIAYQGDGYFFIAEEGRANVVRIRLPADGTGPVDRSAGKLINLGPDMANSGIEGVAYRAADNTVFAVKETGPSRMYRIALDGNGNPATVFPDEPFDIAGKSGDAADILALDDGNFILVNQEQNRLEGFDGQGRPLATLPLGMSKPEGIALDQATGTLYIVGEPREFTVLRPPRGTWTGGRGGSRRGANALAASWIMKDTGRGFVLEIRLGRESPVAVAWFDASGNREELFRGRLGPGAHRFDLGPAGAGFGFCRLTVGAETRAFGAARP